MDDKYTPVPPYHDVRLVAHLWVVRCADPRHDLPIQTDKHTSGLWETVPSSHTTAGAVSRGGAGAAGPALPRAHGAVTMGWGHAGVVVEVSQCSEMHARTLKKAKEGVVMPFRSMTAVTVPMGRPNVAVAWGACVSLRVYRYHTHG